MSSDATASAIAHGYSERAFSSNPASDPATSQHASRPLVTPPTAVTSTEFVAMSVYFFAVDCLRHLGPNFSAAASESYPAASSAISIEAAQAISLSWPQPSVSELTAAAVGFCAAPWARAVSLAAERGDHEWTWSHQMPHRCFEAVFVASWLEHGLGLGAESRAVTYAVDMSGMEVEWTLGFALAVGGTLTT